MKILFYGKDLSWGITNPWTNSRLEAVTPWPTMPPEGGALHSSPWAFVLPGFCPYFQISRKYLFSSSLQIHSCFESLPPVDSVLKVCGLLVADPWLFSIQSCISSSGWEVFAGDVINVCLCVGGGCYYF